MAEERSPPPPPKDSSVFIGNMGNVVLESDLRELFAQVGNISYIRIKKNPHTGVTKGCAIVCFGDKAAAEKAMTFNGAEIKGRHIRVLAPEERATHGPRRDPRDFHDPRDSRREREEFRDSRGPSHRGRSPPRDPRRKSWDYSDSEEDDMRDQYDEHMDILNKLIRENDPTFSKREKINKLTDTIYWAEKWKKKISRKMHESDSSSDDESSHRGRR